MMKPLDIDAYLPDYAKAAKKRRKKFQKSYRYDYVFCSSRRGASAHRVGVAPHKMLDWRSLEARHAELAERAALTTDALWSLLHALYTSVGSGSDPIWIAVSEDHVLKYDGRKQTYSIGSIQFEVEGLLKAKPDSQNQYRYISYDSHGREVGSLMAKERRLLWAKNTYWHAFQTSVEDRLNKYIDSSRRNMSYYRLNEPFTMIVQNGDRQHVVSCNYEGVFSWHGGVLLTTTHKETTANACTIQDTQKCCKV